MKTNLKTLAVFATLLFTPFTSFAIGPNLSKKVEAVAGDKFIAKMEKNITKGICKSEGQWLSCMDFKGNGCARVIQPVVNTCLKKARGKLKDAIVDKNVKLMVTETTKCVRNRVAKDLSNKYMVDSACIEKASKQGR